MTGGSAHILPGGLPSPAAVVETAVSWPALDRWLRVNTPWSAGDNNPDLLRFFNGSAGTVKVFWLNGNAERRGAPSSASRLGGVEYEYPNGSSDLFWRCSTNPADPGARATLLGVYGTLHATKPGWVTVPEGLEVAGAPITGTGTAVDVTPANGASHSATANVACRLVDNDLTVQFGGRLANSSGGAISSGTVLFQLAAAFRPAWEQKISVRYTGGGNTLTVGTDGNTSFGTGLNDGQEIFFDGVSFVRSWT